MAVGASQAAERRALQFEISSREAELRALRAQIHPHFLFNSLNSINALIAARPEEARKLCVRLGDFLRASLTLGPREAIPLSQELALAEQLLSIEKVRFGERLSHTTRADDDARACTVPPLLLQPLVENAVTHGIAQRIDRSLFVRDRIALEHTNHMSERICNSKAGKIAGILQGFLRNRRVVQIFNDGVGDLGRRENLRQCL
jgi:LytS/YehU family sensor histidine kinase